jgi:heme o synthase
VPVLIGWSAVTNSLDWAPVVLFAVIFFWTPPHFWALAIKYKRRLRGGRRADAPVVASTRTTAVRMIIYTVVLWALTLVFAPVADMGRALLAGCVESRSVLSYREEAFAR